MSSFVTKITRYVITFFDNNVFHVSICTSVLQAIAYTGLRQGYELEPVDPDKLLNPKDIDWCIENSLGIGSFGQVIRGTWRGKPSAIKIANPNHGQEAVDLLKEECSTMSRLDHLNIVTVYGCCEKDGAFVMVMELMYKTLDVLLKKMKKLQETGQYSRQHMEVQIWHIIKDVVSGIKHLHSINLLHRDLKPSNILLDRLQVRAKLCDFGFARQLGQENMTNVGTSQYKAPEIIYGKGRYDKSVDIFSLGRVVELDICPLFPKNRHFKCLAYYCTQPIPDAVASFKEPRFRPSAKNVLRRVNTYLRNFRPCKTLSEFLSLRHRSLGLPKRVKEYNTPTKRGNSSPCQDSEQRKKLRRQNSRVQMTMPIAKVLNDVANTDLDQQNQDPPLITGIDASSSNIIDKDTHLLPQVPSYMDNGENSHLSIPSANQEDYVYITKKTRGGRYHMRKKHWGARQKITLQKAIELGKLPCLGCIGEYGNVIASPSHYNASKSLDKSKVLHSKRELPIDEIFAKEEIGETEIEKDAKSGAKSGAIQAEHEIELMDEDQEEELSDQSDQDFFSLVKSESASHTQFLEQDPDEEALELSQCEEIFHDDDERNESQSNDPSQEIYLVSPNLQTITEYDQVQEVDQPLKEDKSLSSKRSLPHGKIKFRELPNVSGLPSRPVTRSYAANHNTSVEEDIDNDSDSSKYVYITRTPSHSPLIYHSQRGHYGATQRILLTQAEELHKEPCQRCVK